MEQTINGPLQGRILQGYIGHWTEDKKIWSFYLRVTLAGHHKDIAQASYYEVVSDPTQSFINHRAALHAIKITAISLNADILNLDEFDPRCPACSSYALTEEVEGDYCCLTCGEEGPITAFFTGGMTAAYINFHSQHNADILPPQAIADRSQEKYNQEAT